LGLGCPVASSVRLPPHLFYSTVRGMLNRVKMQREWYSSEWQAPSLAKVVVASTRKRTRDCCRQNLCSERKYLYLWIELDWVEHFAYMWCVSLRRIRLEGPKPLSP
jgi:hypothetical protein